MRYEIRWGFRILAGVLAIGALATGALLATIWVNVRDTGIGWLLMALFEVVLSGAFGYAAISGRSPMPQDRAKKESVSAI